MQMGDYRLDHLVGFDLHGKNSRDYWNWKIGAALQKIMHGFGCQILACDPRKIRINPANISYTTLEDVCKIQM
jgi:D-lactate dehydrogenase